MTGTPAMNREWTSSRLRQSGASRVSTCAAPVETSAGRVRGFERAGIHTFLGIPYGASTSGQARFRTAAPAVPWAGIRAALAYGSACPQADRRLGQPSERAAVEEAFLMGWNDTRHDEDCLRLNVWTPGPAPGAKRPVMVWLHGGHYSAGSANEAAAFDGTNLSRRGDIVLVSVNHRLNALGFLNLEAFGESFAGSANAGMTDIVLALRWIRENIDAFGGDPGNVTIFGQSGGGGKVTTLMAMPDAAGLFHRAIVQSNCALRQMPMETSLRLTFTVLRELDIPASDVRRLREIPYEAISRAERAAISKLCPPPNPARRNRRIRWEPVVDGVTLPDHAFGDRGPAVSSNVPLLVGTTLNEFHNGVGNDLPETTTEADLSASLEASFGDTAARIRETFRSNHPGGSPFDILSRIYGATIRQSAVNQATMKMRQAAAPAWLYWFTWHTPVLDRRPRAYHNAELPFVFANAERCATATGGGDAALALEASVADAWIAFARCGNPNHDGLPEWPCFAAEGAPTMVFDNDCFVASGTDEEERKLVGEA